MMIKKYLRTSFVLNGALLIALSLATTACGGKDDAEEEAKKNANQVPEVEVLTVEQSSADLAQSYPATLKGKTDIEIRPQVAGAITNVLVDEGQRVKKGQTLFTIDQVTYQSAVEQAKAMVNSAVAAVNTAKTNVASQQMLFDKGIISQIVLKQAQDQLAQAQAAQAQAQAALTSARKNLSYTVVTAPSDGVVGAIPFREGSYVSPQSMLTTISDNSEMYAYFSLNENDIVALTNNGERSVAQAIAAMPPVQFQLSTGTIYPLEGRVATISGVIDSSTGALSVRALFPNPSGMLMSGASGSVLVPQHFEDVIVIPQVATFENQDLRLVYAVNDSNVTQPMPIQVAKLSDGKNFIVTGGLQPGQRIVVEGVNTQVRGVMPIKPLTPEQKAARDAQAQQPAQPAQ